MRALFLALLALGAAACEDGTVQEVATANRCDDGEPPSEKLPAVGAPLCETYDAITTNGYRIQNNVWNADSGDSQCIQPRGEGDRVGFDVTGSVISTEAAPSSYPSIVYGWHFSSWTEGTGPEFQGGATLPFQVSEGRSVPASWSATKTEEGRYNVSYDLWLHPQPDPGGNPTGGLEMMIWVHSQGEGVAPSGVRQFGAEIAGRQWSGQQGWDSEISQSWNYVAFRMACRADRTELDLNDFLQRAVELGYLDPNWYLISVQAGFEIWGGGEGLSVDDFHVHVE